MWYHGYGPHVHVGGYVGSRTRLCGTTWSIIMEDVDFDAAGLVLGLDQPPIHNLNLRTQSHSFLLQVGRDRWARVGKLVLSS